MHRPVYGQSQSRGQWDSPWLVESLVSGLGLKKKFLTKALIKSLGDLTEIDGSKVENSLSFSYRKIGPYLNSIFERRL